MSSNEPQEARRSISLWERAVTELSAQDKAILNHNEGSKSIILESVRNAAEQKRELCMRRRWKFRKGKKVIFVRDVLDKIIVWIDKFKQIGDTIIQYDPVHAALPWAAVRFILQVLVFL